MSILTTNISSVSLTVSGNTQKSTNISWSLPSVPNDAVTTSCVLTGVATASMSKGSATIKVNGSTVSSGSPFTINLGTRNTISQVSASVQGSNKNASGTVTFSNLVYTVNYNLTHTVTFVDYDGTILSVQEIDDAGSAVAPATPTRFRYKFIGWDASFSNVISDLTITAQYEPAAYLGFKENNKWVDVSKIYKKISGSWVEQVNDDWNGLFNQNITYASKGSYNPTAILYSNGTLVFSNSDKVDNSYGTVVKTYTGWHKDVYTTSTSVPWWNERDSIYNVQLMNGSAKSMAYWFYSCENLANVTVNNFDTSNVTAMNAMFNYCSALKNIDVSRFNTSNVVDMSFMFNNCSSLTSLDVSSFDVSNVTDMTAMFQDCSGLTSLNLSSFVTSNVTDMSSMFSYCDNLQNIDLSNFDTSNVTDMSLMFYYCCSLPTLDLSHFNTSKVTQMNSMFYHCCSLNKLDLNNLNKNSVTNTSSMFTDCRASNFTIYVSTNEMATWVRSLTSLPTTATVIVGNMN